MRDPENLPKEQIEALSDRQGELRCLRRVLVVVTDAARASRIGALPGITLLRDIGATEFNLIYGLDQQVTSAYLHINDLVPNGIPRASPDPRHDGLPAYPTLERRGDEPVWGTNDAVLPTRRAFLPALNVSLQRASRTAQLDTDPIAIALKQAAEFMPLVVAAGNMFTNSPLRTMYGWALTPGAITVGATDAEGERMLDVSLVGDPETGIPGPTLVASGVDAEAEAGTSFAAPVVTTQIAVFGAVLMMVRASLQSVIAPERAEGVPLAGRLFVDTAVRTAHGSWVADLDARPRRLSALPIAGTNPVAIDAIVSALGAATDRVWDLPGPTALRDLLVASARPVPHTSPHQSGGGFVSDATTETAVLAMSARGAMAALGLSVTRDDPGLDRPMFDGALMPAFLHGVRESMIGFMSGIESDDENPGGTVFVEPLTPLEADPDRMIVYPATP